MARALLVALLAVAAGSASAATHVVEIDRMAFGPMPEGVVPGDTIEWRNMDMVPHTATAPTVDLDLVLAPGQSGTSIAAGPGEVEVVCSYHPGMRARLVVGPAAAPATGAAAPSRTVPLTGNGTIARTSKSARDAGSPSLPTLETSTWAGPRIAQVAGALSRTT